MNLHTLFVLASLVPALSSATSFYLRPLNEFTRDTPNIVRGTVRATRIEDQTDPGGNHVIYTYASLEVKEVLKGPIGQDRIEITEVLEEFGG